MYAPAFVKGFRRLGHNVTEIDYERYHLSGKGFIVDFLNKFQDRYHRGFSLYRYNKDIVNIVERESPEIVFMYRCYHIWPSTLEKLKGKSFIMSYNNDDPFSGIPSKNYYRHHLACAKFCNLNYVYRGKNVEDYKNVGITNTKVLLPYYLTWQNYPINCKKDIELAFIGHFEDDGRDAYIKALVEAGIPIKVFNGSDWEKAPHYNDIKDVVVSGKRGAEYNKTLNKCQIALIFLSKINSDTYTRRCFEIPATKTLMLCEYTEDMDSMFPEDECAVYFRSKEELVHKCKDLLAHPDVIKQMAENGYNRLKELGGSEVDRCRQIVEFYNKYQNE